MPLTDLSIKATKPASTRRKISDGGGLHLEISPNGVRTWKMSYRFGGMQKTVGGGRYPQPMSLALARAWREEVKATVRAGRDPAREVKVEKHAVEQSNADTFKHVAEEWFEKTSGLWKPSHAEWVHNRLEGDAYPVLGSIPIGEVAHDDVLALIRRFEKRDTIEIGRKTLRFVSRIMRYAKAAGKAVADPVPDAMAAMKPKPRVKHHAKLPVGRLPEFFGRLASSGHDPVTKLAIRWTLLTWVRTGETRFFVPGEIEGRGSAEPVWRIPADRMKMNREHLVPLSRQAVALLDEIDALRIKNGSEWQFPQVLNPKKPISENCMLYALYDLGYKGVATIHGFRGVASTLLNEQVDANDIRRFHEDWIEIQLAHEEESESRGAYNAAQYLGPRRRMMQWWADYLEDQERVGLLL